MLLEDLLVNLKINGDAQGIAAFSAGLNRIRRLILLLEGRKRLNLDTSKTEQEIKQLTEALNAFAIAENENAQSRQYINHLREIQREAAKAKREQVELNRYGVLQADGTRRRINLGEALRRKAQGATSTFGALKQELIGLQYANPVLGKLVGSLQMFGAMAGVGFSLQKYLQISDEWKTIEGQIKNVSKDSQEAAVSQKELYNIASRTRQSYAETAGLYTSVSRNASELGKSSTDILKFTEDVSNAMLIGGGSAQSQQAALVQLGQALGSGTLRGDELNSILEQAPRLAKAIADGMGTTIGNLRNLGSQGKITATAVFEAIRKQSEQLKKELGNTPWTVQQATVKVQNAMGMLFYTLEKKVGVGTTIATGIAKVATVLEKINNILADIPAERLLNYLKTAVIYAGVFYMLTKRAAIAQAFSTTATLVQQLAQAFRTATTFAGGLQAMLVSVGTTGAAASIATTGGLILIAALVVALILLIEDLYYWITGGNSLIGEHFGTWDDCIAELSRRWEQWKTEFGKSMDWIGEKFGALGSWIMDAIKNSETLQAVWSTIKSVFEGVWDVLNKIAKVLTGTDLNSRIDALVKGAGKLDANKVASDAATITSKMQTNNQTTYFSFTGKDAKEAFGIFSGYAENRMNQDFGMETISYEQPY